MILFDTLRDGVTTVLPKIIAIEGGRYIATAGLVSLFILAFWRVYFRSRKIQRRSATARDYRREMLASVRTVLIFSMTGFSLYLAERAGWITVYDDFAVAGAAYFGATLALMIVAHDAYFYWTHRAMHHPRLFRLFHWTHHKSRTPTPWTAYAFDIPEAIVIVGFVPLWVALVPMHAWAVFIFVTWQIVRNVIGHAGVELSPVSGRPSRLWGWLNTTTHHDLHHQSGRHNYALYFSWWDRWSGTEHPAYQARVAEIANRSRLARITITERNARAPVAQPPGDAKMQSSEVGMTETIEDERHAHWQGVYSAKAPGAVSWYQERPDISLELIEATGLATAASILDVGAGASTLVDHLLGTGHSALTVLDISAEALRHAQARLASDADRVRWIAADITRWRPELALDLWHDRAVLHFLTAPEDQQAYAATLRAALKPSGWAIIAGFAPGGPLKCSGLEIVQHDADSLAQLLGYEFRLIDTRDEIHRTPWGAEQAFRYHLFWRG